MINSALIPVIRDDTSGDDRWMSAHKRFVHEAKTTEGEVLFIGDSIIQQMQHYDIWREKFNPLHCVNFGIGGDKVENVLWRIQNGEIEFSAGTMCVVVLFVGTNNTPNTAEEIFEGIKNILDVILKKLGDCHVVIPTLLPRGEFPNKLRQKNDMVNDFLANLEMKNVHIVKIHDNILEENGRLPHYLFHDFLHLTGVGYSKIFAPIYDKLCTILAK